MCLSFAQVKENAMNLIKTVREAAGIKQVTLYSALKWPQSRLSNYENEIRTPSLNDAREIVSALNELGATCTLDDVFPASQSVA
jgi:putative transcriptional regulator